jgi:stage II sporulation protein D
MSRLRLSLLCVLLCLAAVPASASAASRFVIRGAGFGHGVGMSQYGAYGFALHGVGYRDILAHYYTGTAIGAIEPSREVRVLLQSPRGNASFTGADRAGDRRLDPARTYLARGRGDVVDLLSSRGRRLATFGAPLRVTGPGPLTLRGRAGNGRVNGAYRGALEFLPGRFGGVNAVNAVNLDDYVQGVVPAESPASWPLDALKAQAVAARTYAVTTSKGGVGWDQYPDTRSQVYAGVAGERPTSNQAVAETRGEVVTYQGTPVVTYFFSTSGGRTENVENTPLGTAPKPWLQSVDDPYDDVSPKHRWGPIRMSLTGAGGKLRGLVKGRFRGVKVVKRGASPRVVAADILGSRGRTRVNGATLRARFGLFDSWAFFTSITSEGTKPPAEEPPPAETDPLTGGASPAFLALTLPKPTPRGVLRGRIVPARRGQTLTIERLDAHGWVVAGGAHVGRGGRYSAPVMAAGRYRVRLGSVAGPGVRIR